MSKKLKLPFMELHKEVYEILSPEELRSIVGGLGDWGTDQGFLSNVNEMISSGMFNYTGSGAYDSGYVDMGGSGGSGGGFMGFNYGSGNGSGANFFNFYLGSSNTQTMFSFGSASGSNPPALLGNFGSAGNASFTNMGGTNPKLQYEIGGKKFTFEYKDGKAKVTLGFSF